MTNWRDIAESQWRAAAELDGAGLERPSVSRAYYAAYSWIVQRLHDQGVDEFGRFNNPDHADVPRLVSGNLSKLRQRERKDLMSAIRRLRSRREDADYRPRVQVDAKVRREALRDMLTVARILGEVTP
jgi:uncharacterized protein (UPF0332 family)